jgi:poly-gamma-glutamate system protein
MMEPSFCRRGTVSPRRLKGLAICALVVLLLLEGDRYLRPDLLQAPKEAAESLMGEAIQAIKAEKNRRGIPIDPLLDPNETGLIGLDYNDLTTTVGSLPSKRTSTQPAFAAIVVEMLAQVGVRTGDPVAITFSGSFPALNIAVLSAVKVLHLRPVILSSVGASMYGANNRELTWLDMESVLFERGILPYRSTAASLGGIADTKGGLDGTGIEAGLRSIRRNGVAFLDERGPSTLREDIQKRLTLYEKAFAGRLPAVFINVGGSFTAMGDSPEANRIPIGLLERVPISNHPDRGLIFLMGEKKVPVIHLLGIKKIAGHYGLPIDPIPLPAGPPGKSLQGGRYSVSLAIAGLALMLLLMVYCGPFHDGTGKIPSHSSKVRQL